MLVVGGLYASGYAVKQTPQLRRDVPRPRRKPKPQLVGLLLILAETARKDPAADGLGKVSQLLGLEATDPCQRQVEGGSEA